MSIGPWQLILILVIVVLLFGTKKLRNLGSDVGGGGDLDYLGVGASISFLSWIIQKLVVETHEHFHRNFLHDIQ